jgi:hypothetical protein
MSQHQIKFALVCLAIIAITNLIALALSVNLIRAVYP